MKTRSKASLTVYVTIYISSMDFLTIHFHWAIFYFLFESLRVAVCMSFISLYSRCRLVSAARFISTSVWHPDHFPSPPPFNEVLPSFAASSPELVSASFEVLTSFHFNYGSRVFWAEPEACGATCPTQVCKCWHSRYAQSISYVRTWTGLRCVCVCVCVWMTTSGRMYVRSIRVFLRVWKTIRGGQTFLIPSFSLYLS